MVKPLSRKQRRLKLHETLLTVGAKKVYFSPPESIKLDYPCIVYHETGQDSNYADNIVYIHWTEYTVTIMDKDVDSELPETLQVLLPQAKVKTVFTKNHIKHYVFVVNK